MITPDALPMHALLRIAHHALPPGSHPAEAVIRLVAVGGRVRARLAQMLRGLKLSETRFDVLLALYAVGPSPTTLADLAGHADLSRAVLLATLVQLEAHGWITRNHDRHDRRNVFVGLSPSGATVAAEAIERFLKLAGEIGHDLDRTDCRALARACAKVARRAGRLPAEGKAAIPFPASP